MEQTSESVTLVNSFVSVYFWSMTDSVRSPLVQNLGLLLSQIEAGIVIHNPDTSVRYANPSALKMLGLKIEEIKSTIADDKDWHFLDSKGLRLNPEDHPVNRVLNTGKPVENLELGILDANRGQPTWVKVAGFPEYNSSNELQQIVISFIDISQTKNNVSYEKIMAQANDIVLVTQSEPMRHPGPTIVSVNRAFTQQIGYEPDQVNGKALSFLNIDKNSLRTLCGIKHSMAAGKSFRGRINVYSKDETPLWLDINVFPLHNWENRISHFVTIGRDISEIVSREEQLINDALHDPLTSLYNRRGLETKIQRYSKRSSDASTYSLITLDVDRFKQINDHWGHEAGDKVLVEIANIMRDTVRDIDCVSRIGGEEFLILLPAMNMDTAEQVAERIRRRIEQHQFWLNPRDFIMITASLGVAQKAETDTCIQETQHKADAALYQAKQEGRNRVRRCLVPA